MQRPHRKGCAMVKDSSLDLLCPMLSHELHGNRIKQDTHTGYRSPRLSRCKQHPTRQTTLAAAPARCLSAPHIGLRDFLLPHSRSPPRKKHYVLTQFDAYLLFCILASCKCRPWGAAIQVLGSLLPRWKAWVPPLAPGLRLTQA